MSPGRCNFNDDVAGAAEVFQNVCRGVGIERSSCCCRPSESENYRFVTVVLAWTERSELEIGWTFLARVYWGGNYDGEMKRLMLDQAFTFVDCHLSGLDKKSTIS